MNINIDGLKLVRPNWDYWKSFAEAVEEFRAYEVEDFSYPLVETEEQFENYLMNMYMFEDGSCLPDGYVPSTRFWLVDGKHFIGNGDVRHCLNESLMKFGGHIGYSIRPKCWGRGLGSYQLALLLWEAWRLRIPVARITCFDENTASARVMEKNGAVLIDKVFNDINGAKRLTRIYEVDLTKKFAK